MILYRLSELCTDAYTYFMRMMYASVECDDAQLLYSVYFFVSITAGCALLRIAQHRNFLSGKWICVIVNSVIIEIAADFHDLLIYHMSTRATSILFNDADASITPNIPVFSSTPLLSIATSCLLLVLGTRLLILGTSKNDPLLYHNTQAHCGPSVRSSPLLLKRTYL